MYKLITVLAIIFAMMCQVSFASVYNCDQMKDLTKKYITSDKSLATTMICIAYYESSWNTHAYNPSSATGLWQLLGEHCKDMCSSFCKTPSDLYDASINARCAEKVLKSQGLDAWTTYSNGDCKDWKKCDL
ncbi:hypothetical protein DFA_02793 [Cavenderia fasciculata]|uniref:Transglycosylase SLT domain-containing protein n=1 Tax=Cavenderia fasciculata TaxID=261658 RepID=F4PIB6_CACFS|nr:uncharacterized protein DFA_02793 [Cavenderia fasciculata]EGG24550.1 hypothetical protein DFA_02793 [Cavenderia fasciculata]|eukprot:XP_004362401.1 hypothetical protein DFA_02793 [Cavenderia fasciculata]